MIVTSGKLRPSITALAVLVTSSVMAASVAHATELKVLSPHVMKPALNDLTPSLNGPPATNHDFLCNYLSTR